MIFQRYKQLIPALVLLACCINTIITAGMGTVTLDGADYNFALEAKHYGAFAATVVTLASFFLASPFYKHCLVLTLILSLFGLINFTALQMTWGLGFGDVSIGLSPILLLVSLVIYVLNSQRINTYLCALIKPSDEKIARIQQEEIAEFKSKFSRKSTEELTKIVASKKLIPSALTAAKQLLNERQ
jgi:cytochrome c oxidase subunit IV